METFESDNFSDICGWSNPDRFESNNVVTVVSTVWLQNNMAANQNILAVLVGLISSLVTCVLLNIATLTVHLQHFNILRVLSVSDGKIARHKHLE